MATLNHPAIELSKVTKTYGKARGVTDLNLTVPEGTVFGFIGPNGAGKTTTISLLINLTRPTSGGIKIFGRDGVADGLKNRARIGYLAGDMALDKGLTGRQQLRYFGHLRGKYHREYVDELARRLSAELDRKIKTLSRGNRQKIALIAALMHKPDLLLLDEPTSGLDPLVQDEFNKIILEHKAGGGTAFISSHVLSEVQELCDHVAIIRQGTLVTSGSMKDLTHDGAKQVRLKVSAKYPTGHIEQLDGVENVVTEDHTISFTYKGDINILLHHVTRHPVKDLVIEDTDLDKIFRQYYEGEENV